MKNTCIYFIFLSIFFLSINNAWSESERDHADYWINVYSGAITKHDDPLAVIAYDVFNTVKHAADKCSKRLPKLIILKNGGGPWAMAIKDGSVLISHEAVQECFNGVDQLIAKSRLAFIFGHEIAHLFADEYWEENAFQSVRDIDHPAKKKSLVSLFKPDRKDINKKNLTLIKKREIKADSFGLLYAHIAGFDPMAILDANGEIFFSQWVTGPDNTHPSPELRASFLTKELQQLSKKIDLFHLGIRLYQLGKYDDALSFMMAFQEHFPSREVFNVLGLIHYQKAAASLLVDKPEKILRFKLSTLLDSETRLKTFDTVRSAQSKFNDNIQKAIFYFKAAINKDPLYLPSLVNLSSAYIINYEYYDALAVLDKALIISNDDPDVLNNQAIALYLQSPLLKVDLFQQAFNKLNHIIQKEPHFPNALYNIGRLMLERHRDISAKEFFALYLKVNPFGLYSKKACKLLGQLYLSYHSDHDCFQKIKPFCQIPLGRMNAQIRKQIKALKLDKHELPMSTVIGNYYSGNGYLLLVLEDVIELVEYNMTQNKSFQDLDFNQCHPLKRFANCSGRNETFLYKRFALETQNNTIKKLVHYGNRLF